MGECSAPTASRWEVLRSTSSARPRAETGTDVERKAFVLLGQGTTDGDGRFQIDASRARSAEFVHVYALAGSGGAGFGCVQLESDAERPAGEISLLPEQVIQGRLTDIKGYLTVMAPTLDYVPREIAGGKLLFSGQRGGSASTPTRSSPTRSRPDTKYTA